MCRESPVPKAFGIGGDESARNEISILIAGMPRAVRREHHYSILFLFDSTAQQLPVFNILYAMEEEMTIGRYVALLLIGLSPKSFFVAGCIEHMGVFYATTIGLWASVTTPAPYV